MPSPSTAVPSARSIRPIGSPLGCTPGRVVPRPRDRRSRPRARGPIAIIASISAKMVVAASLDATEPNGAALLASPATATNQRPFDAVSLKSADRSLKGSRPPPSMTIDSLGASAPAGSVSRYAVMASPIIAVSASIVGSRPSSALVSTCEADAVTTPSAASVSARSPSVSAVTPRICSRPRDERSIAPLPVRAAIRATAMSCVGE